MKLTSKEIEYKGRVVFQKVRVSSFERLPKAHFENEACFVFIQQGEFYVRAQTKKLLVNKETALLAKCLHYFYETAGKSRGDQEDTEVVGVLFYPELVQNLFEFDLNASQLSDEGAISPKVNPPERIVQSFLQAKSDQYTHNLLHQIHTFSPHHSQYGFVCFCKSLLPTFIVPREYQSQTPKAFYQKGDFPKSACHEMLHHDFFARFLKPLPEGPIQP